jgi:dipeptidyl-peptidase 9
MQLTKSSPTIKRLKPTLKERFPWCEYMPRFGWTPNGEKYALHFHSGFLKRLIDDASSLPFRIWVQLLDRKQQRSMLATIDVDQFVADGAVASSDANAGVTVLREENTKFWINVTDLIYFFKDGSGRVLIGSEETMFRHLYLLTPKDAGKSYSSRAITVGDGWQVDDALLRVDEARGFVYFMGTKDSALEAHLYAASLSSDADPYFVTRLTPPGFKHSVQMSSDLSMFVSCFSNVNEPHRTQIYAFNHSNREGRPAFPTVSLRATFSKASVLSRKPSKFGVNPPEMFSFKNSHDETVHGCFFKPRNFDPTRKYPAVLFVYAGPHVQYVTNDYSMNHMFMALQMYAHLGFVGIVIDGVGSWRRGLKFEGYLREKMGTVEVQEQVQGVSHLIQKGFVDPERVAVRGWSYGGYMALLCLAQRPDFFKVAISGAPVTKWEAYDTGYTERYMDTPQNNPKGYKEGSVMHYVNGFPDDPNRLLIIHGAIDENVHFCNSLELIQSLIEHDKPYQLLIFPRERHGVRNPASSQYLETQILRFILSNL